MLEGQVRLYKMGPEDHMFLNLHGSYTDGDNSLDYSQKFGGGLVFRNYYTGNTISLFYRYEKEKEKRGEGEYYLNVGKSKSHTVNISIKWRF